METQLKIKAQRYLVKMERTPDGWRECECLSILRDGEQLSAHLDGGEPEDNTLSWVSSALKEAYDLGVEDGKEQAAERDPRQDYPGVGVILKKGENYGQESSGNTE